MKVKEVYFEKLFSLEKYNNERIGLRAEVSENENADKVAGELFFKIMEIEDCLNIYRNVLTDIDYIERDIEGKRHEITHISNEIEQMKTTIEELARLGEKGDIDAKLRHACETKSYKQLSERLQVCHEELAESDKKHQKLIAIKLELQKRFKNGNFSLVGINYPIIPRREYF
jgi:predicted RNase H-like nuclease (RuvC/YqgF family)